MDVVRDALGVAFEAEGLDGRVGGGVFAGAGDGVLVVVGEDGEGGEGEEEEGGDERGELHFEGESVGCDSVMI